MSIDKKLIKWKDAKFEVSVDESEQILTIRYQKQPDNVDDYIEQNIFLSDIPEPIIDLLKYMFSLMYYGMELNEKAVAKLFTCSIGKVRDLRRRNLLPSYKDGKNRKFNIQDCIDYFSTNKIHTRVKKGTKSNTDSTI